MPSKAALKEMKRIKDLRPDATSVQMVMGNSEHDGTKNLHSAVINSDRVKYNMRNMDDYAKKLDLKDIMSWQDEVFGLQFVEEASLKNGIFCPQGNEKN